MAEIVDACRHVRMIGTEGLFIDLERALESGSCIRVFRASKGVHSYLIEQPRGRFQADAQRLR